MIAYNSFPSAKTIYPFFILFISFCKNHLSILQQGRRIAGTLPPAHSFHRYYSIGVQHIFSVGRITNFRYLVGPHEKFSFFVYTLVFFMHIRIFMHDGEKSECWQGPR